MPDLQLREIWQPDEVSEYKVHFARWNQNDQPLHVLSRSPTDWRAWQEFYPGRNDFNRPHIFSLAQMPDAQDIWMFGGIWNVLGLEETVGTDGSTQFFYRVEKSEELDALVGRMKLHRVHRVRTTRVNLENHFADFIVTEVLPDRYSGRPFPGFHLLHVSFEEFEMLVDYARVDWSTALSSIKGVYLITDDTSGRRYVGSAYGTDGIWSRWTTYVRLGHGGNAGMMELLNGRGLEYCRKGFRFALLESLDVRTPDHEVIARENHWKDILDTRHVEHGLNRN
jgi:hypothetical protein